MMDLALEFERKWRNLDPQDRKKVVGFFFLVQEGDKQAEAIWSLTNDEDVEPEKVAELILNYMDFTGDQITNLGKARTNELEKSRIPGHQKTV